jgi:hypothetical protein
MRAMLWLISALIFAVGCSTEQRAVGEREVSIAYLGTLVHYEAVLLKDDISISGRVVATDKMGEIANAVVIADETAGVALQVETSNSDIALPLYSKATVHCSGLYLAREGQRLVIGNRPTAEYSVDRLTDSDIALHTTIDTLLTTPPSALLRTIPDITSSDMLRYVLIDDVEFVEQGKAWFDCDSLGSPLPSLRHITDGRDTLTVVVNDATIYGAEPLPSGTLNCYGIIDSHEGELVLRIINKQAIKQ